MTYRIKFVYWIHVVLTADELRAKMKICKSLLLSCTVRHCHELSDLCFLLIIDKNHLEESSESQVFTLLLVIAD